ncbi:hypothetical protein [Methylobacterium sp. J-092]|uniref:hypothetical protein n=1 Tax=Methylobacterium sp. J-092 TaxID=2836667 RepID=UPI001FBB8D77|nr:hypothetical protein [Methylobacterium sp. J-092]
MIGLDLAPERLRPLWLIHDAHEARIGDMVFPVHQAAVAVEAEQFPGCNSSIFQGVWAELKRRHDVVIHAAAGIALPTKAERDALKAIDLRCLAIEHRDFHRPSERRWQHELDGIEAGRGTVRRFMPPDKVADQLAARFYRYLPALQAEAEF